MAGGGWWMAASRIACHPSSADPLSARIVLPALPFLPGVLPRPCGLARHFVQQRDRQPRLGRCATELGGFLVVAHGLADVAVAASGQLVTQAEVEQRVDVCQQRGRTRDAELLGRERLAAFVLEDRGTELRQVQAAARAEGCFHRQVHEQYATAWARDPRNIRG